MHSAATKVLAVLVAVEEASRIGTAWLHGNRKGSGARKDSGASLWLRSRVPSTMFRHMDIWSPREPWQSPETNVGPGFRTFKYYKVVNGLNSQFLGKKKTSQNDDSQSPTSFNTSPTFRKTAAKKSPKESKMSPTWSNESPTFDQTAATNGSKPVQLEANFAQHK